MKRAFLVFGLVTVAFACSEQAGQVLTDAGQMMMDAGQGMVDAGNGMMPDAGAQQSKNVTCSEQATNGGNPWFRYSLVDVGDTRFPDVTVRMTFSSWADQWPNADVGGLPSGRYVTEYHGGSFIGDRLVVQCNGTEESITVFY